MNRFLNSTAVVALVAALAAGGAFAQAKDAVTIGWQSDIPSWDPTQRTSPDSQSIFKAVFDQPLDQAVDLSLRGHLAKSWTLSPDGLTVELEFRDDVVFHNGDRMTSADFRYSFFERPKSGEKIDIANFWRNVTDIETPSPTKAVIRLSKPMPTAPQWLAFFCSYVLPKKYMESVGADAFRDKPVGSGPYKVVEYQLGSRMVLERNDAYWGPKPEIRRVTIQVIKDASARVAAVQSGQVDLTVNVPVREAERLGKIKGYGAALTPITRVVLLQIRNDLGFADPNVRLALHHAIDKDALSKAFYNGAAVPLSVVATPGSPGHLADFKFPHDPAKSAELLAKSGFGPNNPAKIKFASTNGHFPSDYDIARALVAMWKKVGIEAELETIEYAKYFELNRGHKLPEATLYSWDNASGDPEIFSGYLLNPSMPFSAWKGEEIGAKVAKLFGVVNYQERIQGYRAINREAVETGASVPLLQSVITVVHKDNLNYARYGNGWILPQSMTWK